MTIEISFNKFITKFTFTNYPIRHFITSYIEILPASILSLLRLLATLLGKAGGLESLAMEHMWNSFLTLIPWQNSGKQCETNWRWQQASASIVVISEFLIDYSFHYIDSCNRNMMGGNYEHVED